jgi:mannose-6-phosphate isomerase-like protein (cupin superfamily)
MSARPRLFKLSEMAKESLRGGTIERTAIRTDGALVTFNWFKADREAALPHSHPFDQLALVISGKVIMQIGDEEFTCEAGSAVYIPKNIPHTGKPLGDDPLLLIDIFAPARNDYLYFAANQFDWDETPNKQQTS